MNELFQNIKRNPKFKSKKYINVLLNELIHPHTFFNYIFYNKTNYENNQIPNEVFLHERTHTKQKHTLDILFIEILQIVFWFNPLLYFIKKDIKLNHEFLADQTVLKNGINITTYQKTLLAFSSNASHSSLANAINYSSIKKRFTVMKTQTSKNSIWLRSFILLPLLAILIYGFSEKKFLEKKDSDIDNEIKVFINKEKKVLIENKLIDFKNLSEEIIKISNNSIKNNETKPSLFLEIEGHVSVQHLEDIKNEIYKSKLKISMLKANSISLDENEYKKGTKAYFKETQFTADSIQFKNKKGISKPKVVNKIITTKKTDTSDYNLITIKIPKNSSYKVNSNDLKSIDNHVKTLIEKNHLKTLTIQIKKNKTIFINNKKCSKENLEKNIINFINKLSPEEKEKLSPVIFYNSPDGDETFLKLNEILKKLKISHTNKEMKVRIFQVTDNTKPEQIKEYNKIEILKKDLDKSIETNKQLLNNDKTLIEYNKLIKKFNSNPEGIFKQKDVQHIKHLYDLMTKEQKENAETLPKSVTQPPESKKKH